VGCQPPILPQNNAWQEQANKIIMLNENANAECPR
jgi:hypothetical protein